MPPGGEIRLCPTGDIPDGTARGFEFDHGGTRRDVLVYRAGTCLRAFVNACPHSHTPLETFPDRFMSRDGRHLLCSTHGARFRTDDGLCVAGPCKGKYLTALDTRDDGGHVAVRPDPAPRKETA